LLDNS